MALLKILELISTKSFFIWSELSDDQAKSSSSLFKKLSESETNLTFKFSGNKKQFEFNTETLFRGTSI